MGRNTDLSDHNPIAVRRVSAGLTQEQLAELVGIKRAQIALLEAGKCYPRKNTAQKLAQALGCSPGELIQWEGEP